MSYPNGTSTTYVYDALNRLETIQTLNNSNQIISQFDYTLYPTGHRHTMTDLQGNVSTYLYDEMYRLTSETINHTILGMVVNSYDYDAVGNRDSATENGITTTYAYDMNDRIVSSTQNGITTTYSYDDNGNTLHKAINNANSDETAFSYDARNKLTTAVQYQTNNPVSNVTFEYDIDGNRIQKTDNGNIINFIVDRNQSYAQVIHETDAQNVNQVTYTHGDDLISQDRSNTINYYNYDGLGSTRSLTDSTGQMTDTYLYSAYGELLDQAGNTENDYLYTGEQFDASLDHYYLRARYYDPASGRFTQMDTYQGRIGEPASLHKYLYVYADPINGIDPSGQTGLFGFTVAQNINTILITTSVLATTNNVFQIATGEKELTAKEIGIAILIAAAGPAAGKVVSLIAKKSKDKILKIPGRVRSRINLAKCVTRNEKSGRCEEGFEHIKDEHFPPTKSGKSEFTISEDELRYHLQSSKVISAIPEELSGGSIKRRFLRTVKMSQNIGIDAKNNNKLTKYLSIVTDEAGNILTATPGKILK